MRRLLPLAALAVLPAAVAAQGSISNQGYGYPTGGLSGAAAALAGANAEIDPNSAVNPAAITRSNRLSVMLRFEPEFRRTTLADVSADASVLRFPAFQATGGYGRFVGALSVSSMLDRTWRNQYADTLLIGGDAVGSVLQAGSEGAMSDARAAVGFVITPKLQVGAALHALVGENRTLFLRTFDPASGVSTISQSSSFGFTGTAVSVGAVAEVLEDFVIAGSARFGNRMSVELLGTDLAEGTVPARFGLGLTYFGIRGISLFGRVDRTQWTDMASMVSDSTSVFDATDVSLGVEALGPRVLGAYSSLRAGLRQRTLPFGVNGAEVGERGFAFGVALPLARGRGQIDIGAQRMFRDAAGIEESGWLLSLGLGIRP
jgi:hypothetical protein